MRRNGCKGAHNNTYDKNWDIEIITFFSKRPFLEYQAQENQFAPGRFVGKIINKSNRTSLVWLYSLSCLLKERWNEIIRIPAIFVSTLWLWDSIDTTRVGLALGINSFPFVSNYIVQDSFVIMYSMFTHRLQFNGIIGIFTLSFLSSSKWFSTWNKL